MVEYAKSIGVKPGFTSPFGGPDTHTIGEIIDTRASDFLAEQNTRAQAPEAMIQLLTTMAELAERSGFDRDTATFQGAFLFEGEINPNLAPHSDGLGVFIDDGTQSVRATRFVYALGPGTLIYPGSKEEGRPIVTDYNSKTGFKYIDDPTDRDLEIEPRSHEFTDKELMKAGAQQVMPGVVLAFDPTRTFWHKAPDNTPRPVLVIDVSQVS